MSVISNNILAGASGQAAGGYSIDRSLRFNSPDSAHLSRTPASAGNRRVFTFAFWIKRSKLGSETIFSTGYAYNDFKIQFDNDKLAAAYYASTLQFERVTSQVFRDLSAWYHIVWSFNSSTSANLYVNGELVSNYSSSTGPAAVDTPVNNTAAHYIGSFWDTTSNFNGYIADFYFIDGQALDPTSFGEFDQTTGVWNPKAYTGSYGTNGWHLELADNSSLTTSSNVGIGKDTSGNGNYWVSNNLSVTAGAGNDSLVDVPTNGAQTDTGVGGEVRGNYCTLNPLDKNSSATLSNGNLDYAAASGAWRPVRATIGVAGSGKWYWEVLIGPTAAILGIATQSTSLANDDYPGIDSTSYGYLQTGVKYNNGSSASYGNSFTAGDVIGVAFDATNGKLWFSKNGTWQASGDPAAGTNAAYTSISTSLTYFPMLAFDGSGTSSINFGQRAFAYTAPSGFKALCTANLPTPSVTKGSSVMDVALWTGNNSARSITLTGGMSPDFVWIKQRSSTGSHSLYDVVRGTGKTLSSNATNAEASESSTASLTSFDSTGFSLGTDNAGIGSVNQSGYTYVGWAFDGGTTTSSNNQGSISSQVRANASAGFSIVTYSGNGTSGATVGHGGLVGLDKGMIIVKTRTGASVANWMVYHGALGPTKVMEGLNTTSAASTSSASWNDTAPTSTVFTLGNESNTNGSGRTFVAYCFAPVVGYSAMGSYTGNGSSDGPFIFTGFRPRFVLLKRTSSTSNWAMFDSSRNTYNTATNGLFADLSDAETTGENFDILSNGFKLRATPSWGNVSSSTYIYFAVAESPFNYARAR